MLDRMRANPLTTTVVALAAVTWPLYLAQHL